MEEQQRARAEAEGRIGPDGPSSAGEEGEEERPRPPSRKRRLGRGSE
jgi:hypothetical protein